MKAKREWKLKKITDEQRRAFERQFAPSRREREFMTHVVGEWTFESLPKPTPLTIEKLREIKEIAEKDTRRKQWEENMKIAAMTKDLVKCGNAVGRQGSVSTLVNLLEELHENQA